MNNRISAVFVLMMAVLFSSCTNLFNDLLWEDKLVFNTVSGTDFQIYVMNTDGSGVQALTDLHSQGASWSPDGSQILFASNRGSAYWSIYVMDEDGSNQVKVLDLGVDLGMPTWSPDGSKICFTYKSNWSIGVANADGSNPHQISSGPGLANNTSSWSPDGSRIAFTDSTSEIWIVNANGTYEHSTGVTGSSPTWSPDGRKIAFNSSITVDNEIYVMNPDGTGVRNITNRPTEEMIPSWSPDGSKMTFTSTRAGNWNVYIMDADGSNQTRLTYFSGTTHVYLSCFYRKPR